MPVTQKQKASRGVPRKASRPSKKQKHARYLAKSTCYSCKIVFRSPKYKRHHEETGHASKIGLNKMRTLPMSGLEQLLKAAR